STSRPEEASPTTEMSCSISKYWRRPWRTTAWSSAMTTVMVTSFRSAESTREIMLHAKPDLNGEKWEGGRIGARPASRTTQHHDYALSRVRESPARVLIRARPVDP